MSRRHPRIRADLAATLTIAKTGELLVCRTRDVSRRGCYLDTAQLLDLGTKVSIALVDTRGIAIEVEGEVTRCPPPRPDGLGRGVGIRFDDPPMEWRALVDYHQRGATRPDTPAVRLRVLVMGDARRQRGAMALYVTSGWDIRFVPDLATAEEVLRGVKLNAVIAESDLDERQWPALFDIARRLQPQARRVIRAVLDSGDDRDPDPARSLIDRIVDREAGLDALLDALTADFQDGRPTSAASAPAPAIAPTPAASDPATGPG